MYEKQTYKENLTNIEMYEKRTYKGTRQKKAIQKQEATQRKRKGSNTTHNTTTTTSCLNNSKTTAHPPNSRWSVISKGTKVDSASGVQPWTRTILSLNTSDQKDYQTFGTQ